MIWILRAGLVVGQAIAFAYLLSGVPINGVNIALYGVGYTFILLLGMTHDK